MSTTQFPGRFATLPDEQTLAATVTALEEHGFSVEVVDDLKDARAQAAYGQHSYVGKSSRSTRNCRAASTSSSSASRLASNRRC